MTMIGSLLLALAMTNGMFLGLNFNWLYDTLPAKFREKSDFRYLANFGYEF